jgi:LacI family transcriptional regulator
MKRAGLDADRFVAEGDFTRPSGIDMATKLLEMDVDAIFCANDATASGALETIKAAGLDVPKDVALAGFDDLPVASELHPPLTTIRQGVHAQGIESASALLSLLENPEGGPRRVLLPTELVIRQSTVGGLSG